MNNLDDAKHIFLEFNIVLFENTGTYFIQNLYYLIQILEYISLFKESLFL